MYSMIIGNDRRERRERERERGHALREISQLETTRLQI